MKKILCFILFSVSICSKVHALVINEIMSNPVGDDGGREWVELYNNGSLAVDLATVSVSIKGGTAVSLFPVSGGMLLAPNSYMIIGSTVNGATKFTQDYPEYNAILTRASLSLVNTGVTSLEVRVNGVAVDTLSSYTAAKEGFTYSRNGNAFQAGNPTPGTENQFTQEDVQQNIASSTSQSGIVQAAPPLQDLVLYLPEEKIVVAGAESLFSVFGLTRAGKPVDTLSYTWSFGDGGQGVGSTTLYKYAYPGRYVATVEAGNGYLTGVARIHVRVVTPDIMIASINSGKYGSYIDIENPNTYDLDLSQWRLVIDGASYPFPKNTVLLKNNVTHITGVAMGFASTTVSTSSVVKILFPNLEEITRYHNQEFNENSVRAIASTSTFIPKDKNIIKIVQPFKSAKLQGEQTKQIQVNRQESILNESSANVPQKDTKVASFLKHLFSFHNN